RPKSALKGKGSGARHRGRYGGKSHCCECHILSVTGPRFNALIGGQISAGTNCRICRVAALKREDAMEGQAIGWIVAIVVGGVAGWLAEQFMKIRMVLLMTIVLGIVGAAVASWLLSLLGVSLGGWLGYLIAGFIGACILIFSAPAIRRTAHHRPRAHLNSGRRWSGLLAVGDDLQARPVSNGDPLTAAFDHA